MDILVKILVSNQKFKLNYFSPIEIIIVKIKIAFFISIILAFPYILKEIFYFIIPSLYKNEKVFLKKFIILSIMLFIIGIFFSTKIIFPMIIKIGLSYKNNLITPNFNISKIINIFFHLSFFSGIFMQIPLIINLLIKFKILSYDYYVSKRKFVIILLLILSAIFTPPDIFSQISFFIPIYLLFEITLFVSKDEK